MIPEITWGANFAGIVRYLTEHRDHEVLNIRDVSSVELAAAEMSLTAALSERAKSVVAHVSLAAAHQDGVLDNDTWLACAEATEAELGLSDRQRVVVRHKDKTHDHIHIFWCTVSAETGQTPPRQWFLGKGAVDIGAGALALAPTEVEAVPVDQRVRGPWNHRALIRLQQVCRALEKRFGLRQLRSPREIAVARSLGEVRPVNAEQARREERTGARPLRAEAEAIRSALDAPNWSDARMALGGIGLAMEPSFRNSKTSGLSIAGLLIYDMADPANRMPASRLDIAGRKYGLRQIEKRHADGAQTMDEWWPQRGSDPLVIGAEASKDDSLRLREDYDLSRERHRSAERDKAALRRKLVAHQKKERSILAAKLMRRRRAEAALLAVAERRAFYGEFSRNVRAVEIAVLKRAQRVQAGPLRRSRFTTWKEFLAANEPVRPVMLPDMHRVPNRLPAAQEVSLTIERPLPALQLDRSESGVGPMQPPPPGVDFDDVDFFAAHLKQRDQNSR